MEPLNPSTIPFDVIFNILVCLPGKTLLRYKCVCKDWYKIINDLLFIRLHLQKSLEIDSHPHPRHFVDIDYATRESLYFGDHDDIGSPSKPLVKFNLHDIIACNWVYFVASCNGLVCLGMTGNKEGYIICNPTTRTFTLVHCPIDIIRKRDWILDGFGYDAQHDDYKIVLISYREGKEVWVYSLKSDSWRRAKDPCQSDPLSPLHKKCYTPKCAWVFGHGMLHCIVREVDAHELEYNDDLDEEQIIQIARFNLSLEQWEVDDICFPKADLPPCHARCNFLDGCFYLTFTNGNGIKESWVMKEYGNNESWMKVLPVPKNYQGYLCVDSLVPIPRSSHMRGQDLQGEEQ